MQVDILLHIPEKAITPGSVCPEYADISIWGVDMLSW